ncbi:MAG: cysteine desulfurase family protein [Sphingomicrobium sp.]|nr:aminotransferase class V-fold PLP-dependent enzyme [Sphingomonadales bacterium]
MTDRIYLDHAATTPVLPEAQAAMAEALERWANPSSPHADGRAARAALEAARATIADALGWRHDIILTSGASEAIAIVASGAKAKGRILGSTEHDIVPHAMGTTAMMLRVDDAGVIDRQALDEALLAGPALVAIQQVNNETGVVQLFDEIAPRVRSAGSLLLTDCAQSAGKVDLPDADFIAVSAHKLGGPPGVGALLVRDLASLAPSGGQEKGYRRGTQDMPAAASFAAALATERFRDAQPRFAQLRRRLDDTVRSAGGVVIAEQVGRIPGIGAIAFPGVSAASQLVQLDLAGFAVSAGSACSSGSMKPSRVLAAMGVAAETAAATIRVSFGPATSEEDIDAFLAEWTGIARRSNSAAA